MFAEDYAKTPSQVFLCIEMRGHFPVRVQEATEIGTALEWALSRRVDGYTGPMQLDVSYLDGHSEVYEV